MEILPQIRGGASFSRVLGSAPSYRLGLCICDELSRLDRLALRSIRAQQAVQPPGIELRQARAECREQVLQPRVSRSLCPQRRLHYAVSDDFARYAPRAYLEVADLAPFTPDVVMSLDSDNGRRA